MSTEIMIFATFGARLLDTKNSIVALINTLSVLHAINKKYMRKLTSCMQMSLYTCQLIISKCHCRLQ
ncbi:hypothetical protein AQUCO_09300009v1 [Aquilegia coerulea]|uniref:Uncharacterized protein n=1 Tax=Aquilegia coerulea TaxID=218851 RepID=A0A2G5C577_AQUCA|nr:hypothetical protein AQUCO_09300009v1 [Aquilegia coerulea]